MTKQEFDNQEFGAGMECIVDGGNKYGIVAVDFEERLIGVGRDPETEELVWFDYYVVTLS